MAQYPSMVTIACTPNLMPIQHIYIGHSSLSRHFYSIIYGFAICLLICSHILTFMCNIRRRFDISKNVVRNEELKKILDLSAFFYSFVCINCILFKGIFIRNRNFITNIKICIIDPNCRIPGVLIYTYNHV